MVISEEGTIDDDDTDELDNESIAESILSEKLQSIDNSTKSIQTDLSFDINENLTIMKNNLLNSKSLTSSTTSLNQLKINSTKNKEKPNLPTPIPIVKKNVPERKLSIPLTIPRKSSLIPSKTGLSSSAKSVLSLGSQSSKTFSFLMIYFLLKSMISLQNLINLLHHRILLIVVIQI
jgi:hypothetical protein